MAWFILIIAGLLETAWALLLKISDGFSRPGPTAAFVICLILSMYLLSVALKSLPVGSAYAVWTGIGAAGTAIIGMLWLGESKDLLKILSLLMLIAGIVGLQLASEN